MPKTINIGVKLPELQSRKGLWQLGVEVCQEMDVHFSDMRSTSQKQPLVNARREFSARAHYQHGYTMTVISKFLGHKDHTTVSHYLRTQDNGNTG